MRNFLSGYGLMKKVLISILFMVGSISAPQSIAAGDAVNGARLSQTCMGCHGAPGLRNASPVYKVPMLGGQHADYLVVALKAYKNKERSHPTMQAQSANLSDQDMADIAAYFASQSGNHRPYAGKVAEEGKNASAVCASCHGPEGKADNPAYPKLAGQYHDYIERALLDYKSGKRQNAIMSGFVATLNEEQIKEIAAWFSSQSEGLSAPEITVAK